MIINHLKNAHNLYNKISIHIYNASIASVLIGLLFSRAMISIGFISFIANWIIEAQFKQKWQTLKTQKSLVIVSLIFFLYLIGLSYTSDNERAMSCVKISLILLFPVFYFSIPDLQRKIHRKYLIALFVLSVFVKTVVLYVIFQSTVEYASIEDLYKINFYSNIRLALFTVASIFYLLYQGIKAKNVRIKILIAIAFLWLTYFLYFLSSLTGYMIFFVLIIFSFYLYLKNKMHRNYILSFISLSGLIIIVSLGFVIYYTYNFQKKDIVDFNSLPAHTVNGNLYEHDTLSNFTECGHYVNLYVCRDEMKKEWNKKSEIDFDKFDLKGQYLENTIKRYLSSKNLRKDSVGISKLTFEDIKHIENGCANHLYTKKYSLESKLYLVWWQLNIYLTTGNAGNQSISQRLEYYKASYEIIKNNFWFGVGTGALWNKSMQLFDKMNTKTEKKYWFIVHNQFLYVFASFGLAGFILFMYFFLYPLFQQYTRKNFLFVGFYLIIIMSFLTDNTLETQLGISFFVVFYCLLASFKPVLNSDS